MSGGNPTTTLGGDDRRSPLDEGEWEALLSGIREKDCTPFLGAGIAAPALPTGSQLSRELAAEFRYPFRDTGNLARVTQYIAVSSRDRAHAKRQVQKRIRAAEEGQALNDPVEPHAVLAALDLPVYLTTNYDSSLHRAIDRRHPGKAVKEVARWNAETEHRAGKYRARAPTAEEPLVFHLHGHADLPASMVVTEDDYVEFVTAIAQRRDKVVPPRVQEALAWSSLLFVGYSLNDWNFHVLLRLLMGELAGGRSSRLNVSVQLPPDDELLVPERRAEAEAFLAEYLDASSVHIHWGDAGNFLDELVHRYTQ